MTSEFSTKVKITLDCKNGELTNYPYTHTYAFEFDATDLTIVGYIEQFRTVLRAAGFSEKSIEEHMGEF
jgi:adenosine deaminase